MKKTAAIKTIGLALLVAINAGMFAQSGFDGNTLTTFLGKPGSGAEVKDLKAKYHCEMANEGHYLSKDGIELILKDGNLNEIHLFNKSAVYGSFTGKLPHNLKFGMTSGDVKSLLGKPVVAYNSTGYCEFELNGYIISCWMEGGKLNQVGLALK